MSWIFRNTQSASGDQIISLFFKILHQSKRMKFKIICCSKYSKLPSILQQSLVSLNVWSEVRDLYKGRHATTFCDQMYLVFFKSFQLQNQSKRDVWTAFWELLTYSQKSLLLRQIYSLATKSDEVQTRFLLW